MRYHTVVLERGQGGNTRRIKMSLSSEARGPLSRNGFSFPSVKRGGDSVKILGLQKDRGVLSASFCLTSYCVASMREHKRTWRTSAGKNAGREGHRWALLFRRSLKCLQREQGISRPSIGRIGGGYAQNTQPVD